MKAKDLMARLQSVVSLVRYKHWAIVVREKHNVPFLRVEFWAESTKTGEQELQVGRPWMLTADMTDDQVVRTALAAVLAAEEHEAREHFAFDGRPIFGPHMSLDGLANACLLKPEFGLSNPILDLM